MVLRPGGCARSSNLLGNDSALAGVPTTLSIFANAGSTFWLTIIGDLIME